MSLMASPLARRILKTVPRFANIDLVFPLSASNDHPASGFSKSKARADELGLAKAAFNGLASIRREWATLPYRTTRLLPMGVSYRR